ncbi:MAG: hypothetical protein MZV63_44055 [Marinilabiliales bacterium]|nr:hypothetical protein [Marinilabiliales bacterium]
MHNTVYGTQSVISAEFTIAKLDKIDYLFIQIAFGAWYPACPASREKVSSEWYPQVRLPRDGMRVRVIHG